MSQEEAAAYFGISYQRYHDAEAARLPERDVRALLAMVRDGGADAPPVTWAERCAVARRRMGWTLDRAASVLGVSRVTYLERERTGDVGVVAMWAAQGFLF